MKHTRFLAALSLVFSLSTILFIPLNANGQTADPAQNADRLDRIEHNMMLLQRQVSRGETVAAPAGDETPASGSAQLEIRLSAIEDQMRQLQGKIEENENRTKQNADALAKFQKDTEFRFNELSTASAATASAPAASSGLKNDRGPTPLNQQIQSLPSKSTGAAASAHNADDAGKADDAAPQTTFASPREHYNYAFRLLNQTQYEESATAFESFTKKYPKDPLVGNAFYWEGETFYIRRDYVNAADNFRKGFEALPEGPKAADNLLKLAMSLDALNRDKEACLVLDQVVAKFKKTSSSVADKADQESKRISCHKS